jgi:uncharacterized protein (DUF362 family)
LENAKRIFVKPNIVSSEPYPTTTHPEVLEALLSWLSSREIVVGDGPAVDAGRSDKVLRNTPLKEILEKHNVSFEFVLGADETHKEQERLQNQSIRDSFVL